MIECSLGCPQLLIARPLCGVCRSVSTFLLKMVVRDPAVTCLPFFRYYFRFCAVSSSDASLSYRPSLSGGSSVLMYPYLTGCFYAPYPKCLLLTFSLSSPYGVSSGHAQSSSMPAVLSCIGLHCEIKPFKKKKEKKKKGNKMESLMVVRHPMALI